MVVGLVWEGVLLGSIDGTGLEVGGTGVEEGKASVFVVLKLIVDVNSVLYESVGLVVSVYDGPLDVRDDVSVIVGDDVLLGSRVTLVCCVMDTDNDFVAVNKRLAVYVELSVNDGPIDVRDDVSVIVGDDVLLGSRVALVCYVMDTDNVVVALILF